MSEEHSAEPARMTPPRWMVHVCPLDRECRKYGAPWRIAVRVPGWYAALALRPGDRFASAVDVDAWERGEWVPLGRSRWTMIARNKPIS